MKLTFLKSLQSNYTFSKTQKANQAKDTLTKVVLHNLKEGKALGCLWGNVDLLHHCLVHLVSQHILCLGHCHHTFVR